MTRRLDLSTKVGGDLGPTDPSAGLPEDPGYESQSHRGRSGIRSQAVHLISGHLTRSIMSPALRRRTTSMHRRFPAPPCAFFSPSPHSFFPRTFRILSLDMSQQPPPGLLSMPLR
jgi:hypothetical protein